MGVLPGLATGLDATPCRSPSTSGRHAWEPSRPRSSPGGPARHRGVRPDRGQRRRSRRPERHGPGRPLARWVGQGGYLLLDGGDPAELLPEGFDPSPGTAVQVGFGRVLLTDGRAGGRPVAGRARAHPRAVPGGGGHPLQRDLRRRQHHRDAGGGCRLRPAVDPHDRDGPRRLHPRGRSDRLVRRAAPPHHVALGDRARRRPRHHRAPPGGRQRLPPSPTMRCTVTIVESGPGSTMATTSVFVAGQAGSTTLDLPSGWRTATNPYFGGFGFGQASPQPVTRLGDRSQVPIDAGVGAAVLRAGVRSTSTAPSWSPRPPTPTGSSAARSRTPSTSRSTTSRCSSPGPRWWRWATSIPERAPTGRRTTPHASSSTPSRRPTCGRSTSIPG